MKLPLFLLSGECFDVFWLLIIASYLGGVFASHRLCWQVRLRYPFQANGNLHLNIYLNFQILIVFSDTDGPSWPRNGRVGLASQPWLPSRSRCVASSVSILNKHICWYSVQRGSVSHRLCDGLDWCGFEKGVRLRSWVAETLSTLPLSLSIEPKKLGAVAGAEC